MNINKTQELEGELLFPKKDFGNRSEVRNRLLADLLSRTIYMEKAGTGIKRVKNACKANNNTVNFDFTDAFWVKIYSNKVKVGEKVGEKLTNNQQLIIKYISIDKTISAKKLSEKIGISDRKIEENIKKLKKLNILERIGSARSGYWQIINNNDN